MCSSYNRSDPPGGFGLEDDEERQDGVDDPLGSGPINPYNPDDDDDED